MCYPNFGINKIIHQNTSVDGIDSYPSNFYLIA